MDISVKGKDMLPLLKQGQAFSNRLNIEVIFVIKITSHINQASHLGAFPSMRYVQQDHDVNIGVVRIISACLGTVQHNLVQFRSIKFFHFFCVAIKNWPHFLYGSHTDTLLPHAVNPILPFIIQARLFFCQFQIVSVNRQKVLSQSLPP